MWYQQSRRLSRALMKDYESGTDHTMPLYNSNGGVTLSRAQRAASIR